MREKAFAVFFFGIGALIDGMVLAERYTIWGGIFTRNRFFSIADRYIADACQCNNGDSDSKRDIWLPPNKAGQEKNKRYGCFCWHCIGEPFIDGFGRADRIFVPGFCFDYAYYLSIFMVV